MNRFALPFILLLTAALTLSASFGPDHFLFGPRLAGMSAADLCNDGSPETILSNPAGLALLNRGQIHLGGLFPNSSATLTLGSSTTEMESPSEHVSSPFLAAAYPINDKLIVGALYSVPSDYTLSWPGEELSSLSGAVYSWRSSLQLKRISLAAAYSVSEKVALGLAVNMDKLNFGYALPFGTGQYEESSDDSAIGFCVGIRLQLTPQLSAGLSFSSAASWDLQGEALMAGASQIGLSGSSPLTRPFKGPSRLAGGITYQFNEKLRLAASFLSSSWSGLAVLEGQFGDAGWTQIFGNHDLELNWESTLQMRIGAEYQASDSLALRAGLATCPSATPEKDRHPLLFSLAGQSVSLGASLTLNHIVIDAAVVVPMSGESQLTSGETQYWPGTYQASMIIPSLSIAYRF